MGAIVELTGKRFGRWTVLNLSHKKGSVLYWNCSCDCGTQKAVWGGGLKSGTTLSCGCLTKETNADRLRSHGFARHQAYRSWQMMKNRCTNENHDDFHNYGGRGITYDPRWDDFSKFWSDMSATWYRGASIDRIDVNGNYEVSNCQWSTSKQQANNRRTNRRIMTQKGAMTITEAAEAFGIPPSTIFARIRYGWPEADLLKPVRKRGTT